MIILVTLSFMKEPWTRVRTPVDVYVNVILSKKIHMLVSSFGLTPNWLSAVAKSGEMQDKMCAQTTCRW